MQRKSSFPSRRGGVDGPGDYVERRTDGCLVHLAAGVRVRVASSSAVVRLRLQVMEPSISVLVGEGPRGRCGRGGRDMGPARRLHMDHGAGRLDLADRGVDPVDGTTRPEMELAWGDPGPDSAAISLSRFDQPVVAVVAPVQGAPATRLDILVEDEWLVARVEPVPGLVGRQGGCR